MFDTDRNFRKQIEILLDILKSKKPFSFSKYADGEWFMMRDIPINNNEFSYNIEDKFFREKLIESFKYKHERYFIGVSCPCCQGHESENMKIFSEQEKKNLTYANIFVNSNYDYFKKNFISEFKLWDVHLVANKNSLVENLPFSVEKFYPVENTAWKYNYDLIEEIKSENLTNKLFLFACGPFGNMLAHQLWDNNKNNIYIDIGSTLNPWTKSEGFHRGYYMEDNVYSNRTCVWD